MKKACVNCVDNYKIFKNFLNYLSGSARLQVAISNFLTEALDIGQHHNQQSEYRNLATLNPLNHTLSPNFFRGGIGPK